MEKYIPKIGENYYYISHCVGCEPIILRRQNCDSLDKIRIVEGNCYKNLKQAEMALKSYKAEWLKRHEELILKE